MVDLEKLGKNAQAAAAQLAQLPTAIKNKALVQMAADLRNNKEEIIAVNKEDLKQAKENKAPEKFMDRLMIDDKRIESMASGLEKVASLPDPIGNVDKGWINHAGLKIEKRRVPLGVIGMIYEARPNVTVDATALCFKAGNAVILRGGKEALQTNIKLAQILRQTLADQDLDPNMVQIITETSHELADKFMQLTDYLDVLIPRGSSRLIQAVVKNASVPVIETGAGNCHIYVDDDADKQMAVDIVTNAKCQRPSVCNAAEKLVISSKCAEEILPAIADSLIKHGVQIRGDERARKILGDKAVPASAADWDTEYDDYIIAVKVVDSLDEAIQHINAHSTKHSESIITNNYSHSEKFLNEIQSACVYVNASTRFTDGGEFGFGAEIGISTQKLHARGPMGLNELTTTKYAIHGSGQVRE